MTILNIAVKVVLGLAVASLGSLYLFQRKLIYPSGFPENSRSSVDKPSSFNMPYEDVSLKTQDGISIKLYVIINTSEKSEKAAGKTVIMLGPNAGNMGHSLPIARVFYDMGYNVVTVSYRGYGLSEGHPSEKGIKLDLEAVAEHLSNHDILQDTSFVLYGRSLGGAASVYFASLPLGAKLVKAIILENTFTSLPNVVPGVFPFLSFLTCMVSEKWRSEELIPNISKDVPFLFLAGQRDELVPPRHMQLLYDLCPATDKDFVEFPMGTHNDTCIQPKYFYYVQQFLRQHVEPVESF